MRAGAITLPRAIELFTTGAARCFGLGAGTLAVGAPSDLCVVDLGRTWLVQDLASKSRNTPLLGKSVTGRAVLTLVDGQVRHDLDGRIA